MTPVYDAGYLVAVDRGDRDAWADHELRLLRRQLPITTAPVIAQMSRSPRQARLHRLLIGCDVAPFVEPEAHQVGVLLAAAGASDVVDAHLVLVASQLGDAVIITSDVEDIRLLAGYVPGNVQVRSV